jgi:antitoxin component HigA of HigAB toxin-antitoxin module
MSLPAPPHNPAEILDIAPENLEVANCYLTHQDIPTVANALNISTDMVSNILSRREVKAYIDNVFLDIGFNNRFKLRQLMDTLIEKKLEELEEAEIGSSKDIADLLMLSHKMTMEHLDKQIKLEEAKAKNIKNQVNVQINEGIVGGGTRYSSLLEKLLQNDTP